VQIQALIVGGAEIREGGTMEGSNTESNIEMAKPLVFNGEVGRVGGIIMACKLYLRMRMREATMKEQIQ